MIHTLRNDSESYDSSLLNKRRFVVKHPIKLTALLYLKEALRNQKYEICPDLVSVAREFGAAEFEIQDILEDPRRSPG